MDLPAYLTDRSRLEWRGDPALLELLPERGLAIVGTRRAQPRALELVRTVVRELRSSELVIVSGLAFGIDAEAHAAALATGLPTVAVLGSPLDRIYPPEHRPLAERIVAAGGLVLTPFPAGHPTLPSNFLERNRLIAVLARATWIAQAPARSGALNTALAALRYHRDVYATPTFPGDPGFAGTERLLAAAEGVTALYGAESLGRTWLELASELALTRRERRAHVGQALAAVPGAAGPDAIALATWARADLRSLGTIQLDTLFNRASEADWTPARFYAALTRLESSVPSAARLIRGIR